MHKPYTRRATASPRGTRFFLLWLLLISLTGSADTVNVAVASNFSETLRQLEPLFRASTGHQLRISPASTGKLYAQIRHGAPYDLFLAADSARPKRLVGDGLALADSRRTYAVGRLVLWSPSIEFSGTGAQLLADERYRYLAIANPAIAPYGAAAEQTLRALQLWKQLQPRLARGENIGQAFQFVVSGAAELGLVSSAQVRTLGQNGGFLWLVPTHFHAPIRQQAVLLQASSDKVAAREFMQFLLGPEAASIIRRNGYLTTQAGER